MNVSVISPIAMAVAFFASVFIAPWWLTVFIGLLLIVLFGGGVFVVIGGFFMDSVFGAPLPLLHGFHFLYTAFFIFLVCLDWYLEKTFAD